MGTLAQDTRKEIVEEESEDIDDKTHKASELFAILDDHLTNATKLGKKENVARLDEILCSSYSDLSALHQMLSIVKLHQPRAPILTIDEAKKDQPCKAWRYIRAN